MLRTQIWVFRKDLLKKGQKIALEAKRLQGDRRAVAEPHGKLQGICREGCSPPKDAGALGADVGGREMSE